MLFSVPSKDKVGTSYPVLPNDNYLAYIHNIKPFEKIQSYNSYSAKGRKELSELDASEIEEVHEVEMVIYALKSGDPLRDVDGGSVEPMKIRVWKRINPKSLGYQKDNSPTHLRAFLAYTLRKDVDGDLACDIGDLIGKFVGVDLVVSEKGSNSVNRFSRVPESFAPNPALIEKFKADLLEKNMNNSSNSGASSSSDVSTSGFSISDVPF